MSLANSYLLILLQSTLLIQPVPAEMMEQQITTRIAIVGVLRKVFCCANAKEKQRI